MNPWTWRGEPLTEAPDDAHGFIYLISVDDKTYVGRKNFRIRRGRKSSQSNWRRYTSSSPVVNRMIKDGGSVHRRILCLCSSQSELNLMELLFQLKYMSDPDNLNQMLNIRLRNPVLPEGLNIEWNKQQQEKK